MRARALPITHTYQIECYDELEAALLRCATGGPATPATSSSTSSKAATGGRPCSAAVAALPAGSLGLALGSRAHLEASSKAQRALYRTVLMKGMHLCVALLCSSAIHDTQCGFKLFTRAAAKSLFGALHLERFVRPFARCRAGCARAYGDAFSSAPTSRPHVALTLLCPMCRLTTRAMRPGAGGRSTSRWCSWRSGTASPWRRWRFSGGRWTAVSLSPRSSTW